MTKIFKLKSKFKPAGDQPRAIKELVDGLRKGYQHQTLLGVTGSGKTFTVAEVVAVVQKPTLVVAHNKTLAAQLAQEYRDFFPEAAVHYFVSYYDYYQPEAYLPATDTYIEKDASINKEIERLRHAATQALLTRRDVIIVASVSCLYGLGSPVEYKKENLYLKTKQKFAREKLLEKLVKIFYRRTNTDLNPGTFRAIGDKIEIMPPSELVIYRLTLAAGRIDQIEALDPISRIIKRKLNDLFIFPVKHFITAEDKRQKAIRSIKRELADQLKKFTQAGKLLEAERLKRRTNYDLALIKEIGYTSGIENYSRHLSGRAPGEPPETLLSYFPKDFLTVIDESHVTVPQIEGMYQGDAARKKVLIEHGFRLPSALDNRPLNFEEFNARVGPIIYTSATPGKYEKEKADRIVEQIIRPTGLVDPQLLIRPINDQVSNLLEEAAEEIKKGNRILVTVLTKKMAEDLAAHLKDKGLKTEYLHSDVKTLARIKILTDFRRGQFDCLVGVNLLREGLDLPEVGLIGILNADQEGFLRSETSLIQTIGRAARNAAGRVILYADVITGSLKRAIDETNRRRTRQLAYNKKHGLTPQTIQKKIKDITEAIISEREQAVADLIALDKAVYGGDKRKLIREKIKQMNEAVKNLDFETAALLRDEVRALGGKI